MSTIATPKKIKNVKTVGYTFTISLLFRLSVSIIAIIVSSIISLHTYNSQGNKYLFLLPLLYAVLFTLMPSMWRYRKGNLGITVLNIVIFTRYVVSPLLRSLSINMPGIRGITPTDYGLQHGMLIIILELFTAFFVVQLLAKRFYTKKIEPKPFQPLNSKFILSLTLLIGVGLWITFPQISNRYNFFIVTESVAKTSLTVPLSGLIFLIADLVLVIFPILALDYFKKKYDARPIFRYVFYSLLSVLPSITIFKGTSRFSVLIPTVAFMMILIKLYPQYTKRLITLIGSILIIVFTSITLYKQFGYAQGESSDLSMDVNEAAYNFDAYMSGPDNMGRVIDLERVYGPNITARTLKNDIINNVALLSSLSDSTDTTTSWFNLYLYGHNRTSDQIVPLSGQSYLHFGPLGTPILLIVTLITMMYFDSKIKYEGRIEYVYLYVYITMYASMAMMVSYGSIYPIFTNLFLPTLAVFYLNRKIRLKKVVLR